MHVVAAIDGGGHAERVTVLIVLFDGVQSLDVTGPLEVFTGAGYPVATAGPGRLPVRTSSGLTLVPDHDLAAAPRPETVVVPGAVLLASSTRYPHQAFRVGERAYGLQFHLETPLDMVAGWAAHDRDRVLDQGLDPDALLERVAAGEGDDRGIVIVWRQG